MTRPNEGWQHVTVWSRCTLKEWLHVKRALIGLSESCSAAGSCCIFTRWKAGTRGGGVRQEREEWAETVTKTMKHMGWQDFKLGGWVGLTHVALVLGYNLAFWLAWNGQCSLWNWISLLYQHRPWKICTYKSACLWYWKYMHSKRRNFHTVAIVYYSYTELWFPLIS